MYAVISHGSHQYRVSEGDHLLVDRIKADVGASVRLEDVLLLGGDGAPDGDAGSARKAVVTATVVAHRRGRKLRVMTYKPKKRHRRTLGYRSQLTELLIESVSADGSKPAPKQAASKAPAKSKPAPAAKALEPEAAEKASSTATAKKEEPESEEAAKPARAARPRRAPAKKAKDSGDGA